MAWVTFNKFKFCDLKFKVSIEILPTIVQSVSKSSCDLTLDENNI